MPEWEKLAAAVKGTATIAYWDTEQGPVPLGDTIRGTPTIRLYIPKKKQRPGMYKEKNVMDYPYERKAHDLKKFLDERMPDCSETIVHGLTELEAFEKKAAQYGLPRAVLFPRKAETMPLTKFLSTEFRRKLLLAQVKPVQANKAIMDQYGITKLPALIVFPVDEGDVFIRYEDEGFTKHKLHNFLSNYALQKMVTPLKKEPVNESKADPVEPKVKVEL